MNLQGELSVFYYALYAFSVVVKAPLALRFFPFFRKIWYNSYDLGEKK
jgi:hypothetical protein